MRVQSVGKPRTPLVFKIVRERSRFEHEIIDLGSRERDSPDSRERVKIDRTLDVPNRWVCRLTVPSVVPTEKGYGAGSGVLISPRHVLTAAHVLVSVDDPGRKTVGDRLRVEVARNGHDKPFESIGISGWQVDPRWVQKVGNEWRLQPQHDYGLVTLRKDVSGWQERRLGRCRLGFWGIQGTCRTTSIVGIDPNQVIGQAANVTGYPGDRAEGTMWSGTGAISYDSRLDLLIHTIDTKPGQSGAPVWLMSNGAACLAGIHSGASGRWSSDAAGKVALTHNAAVILSPARLARIETWKKKYVGK